MRVQVNSDKGVEVTEELRIKIKAHLKKSLSRFDGQVTRLEIHLSDLNSGKSGAEDKRSLLEARPAGMDPVAVTNTAPTVDEAYKGAARKMVRKLTTVFARAAKKAADPSAKDR